MYPLKASTRILFRAALLIFVVTIVIGILNGMDIWQPSRNLLLTHVHAGTLGWITLAVLGTAMLMFGGDAGENDARQANTLALGAVAATVLYVIAFATGTGIFRPIAGTIMLLAIVWALVWVWRQFNRSSRSTPQLGMLLTMVSLTIGAILGVLLGLLIARGSLPGLSTETARSLAGAHPPAMLIGYLILAGVSISDWLLKGPEGKSGLMVVWSFFIAGIVVNLAFILGAEEPLIQVATLLEVVAIIVYLVRMWSRIKPSAWTGGSGEDFARMSIVFLAVGIALLVNVVRLVISGELNPETGEGPVGVLLAFDHAMFIGVMTNALFAVVAAVWGPRDNRISLWVVNGGLALFLVGLFADIAILKQIGAPVMGLALLHGIAVYFMATGRDSEPAVTR